MGFGSLQIATSGIRVAQTHLAITGHNISNAEIPGYSRQRTIQKTSFTRKIGVNGAGDAQILQNGTNWNAVHQIRNEFLDFSYRQNVGRLAFHSTKVNVGIQIETLLGELHGGYNFQGVLNDMWNAIQELSGHPEGIETRSMLLATANSFLVKAQDVYRGLLEYQYNLDAQIRQMVNTINETIAEIERMNVLIRREEASGDNANDFRDERNRLLDRLAEMIPIYVFTDPFGDVGIISGGHQLLSGGVQQRLGLRFISDDFSFVEPVVTNSTHILSAGTPPNRFGRFVNYNRPIGEAMGTDFGQLNALLVARGTSPVDRITYQVPRPHDAAAIDQLRADLAAAAPGPARDAAQLALDNALADNHNWEALQWSVRYAQIPQIMQNLDRMVFSVVSMINDMLTGNLRGADGEFLFYVTDENGDPYIPDPSDIDPVTGNPRRVPIVPVDLHGNEGIPLFIRRDPTLPDLWVPIHVNRDVPGEFRRENEELSNLNSIFTIRNLQINPAFDVQGGHNLLALNVINAPGDNRLLLALQDIWQANDGLYATQIGNRLFNVQSAYVNFTATISADIAEARSFVASQTIQVQQAQALRLSIKGVSMDEELNSMLRFQFAFQSASRVFNVIDSMIETVLGIGR